MLKKSAAVPTMVLFKEIPFGFCIAGDSSEGLNLGGSSMGVDSTTTSQLSFSP